MQSNCCALINGRRVEDICEESLPTTDCKCTDYLYCRLAVVTAISSNHFKQAQDMICSAQKNAPNTDIFVYDLGLKETQWKILSKLHHVEVRTFPFNKYPPHFKNLALNEAWKPVVITELAQEYDVILYGDASLRILKPVESELLPFLLEFPFVAALVAHHAVIPVTPPEMYNYLGLNLTRMQALKVICLTPFSQQWCVFGQLNWLKKNSWSTGLIVPCTWSACPLRDIFAIQPATLNRLVRNTIYKGEYVGCMCCQSIINIILYREIGGEVWKNIQHQELNDAWTIQRHKSGRKFCPVTVTPAN